MPPLNSVTALLLSACAAAFAPAAGASVHETLDYRHYDAHAVPGQALSLVLNNSSPFRPNGKVYHSATSWNIDWQVRPAPTRDGRCAVDEVRIELRGEVVLPRLLDGDSKQEQRFEQYLPRLREHELGHFEIGREAASQLELKFQALPPAHSCGELQAAARDVGARLLPRYEAMGDAYDQKTGHGRTQGAWLED